MQYNTLLWPLHGMQQSYRLVVHDDYSTVEA